MNHRHRSFSVPASAPIGVLAAIMSLAGFASRLNAGPPTLLAADAQTAQLVRLDPLTAAPTVIGPLGVPTVAALAWDSHRGILFATSTSTNQLLRIDPQTGATTVIGSLGTGCCMHGLEYNPANGVLYGLRLSGGAPTPALYRMNPVTGAATLVATVSMPAGGGGSLAFDSVAGVMYAARATGPAGGELYTLNLASGAGTLVGSFNAPHPTSPFPQVGVGMAFHPAFGLYATDNGGLSSVEDLLYRVNTSTGQATLVGETLGANMLGLAFVGDACYPDCNADGALTVADFGCFQSRYVLGGAYADCNADGALTVADFGCFQGKYVLGCP